MCELLLRFCNKNPIACVLSHFHGILKKIFHSIRLAIFHAEEAKDVAVCQILLKLPSKAAQLLFRKSKCLLRINSGSRTNSSAFWQSCLFAMLIGIRSRLASFKHNKRLRAGGSENGSLKRQIQLSTTPALSHTHKLCVGHVSNKVSGGIKTDGKLVLEDSDRFQTGQIPLDGCKYNTSKSYRG